jgi:Protein of unknown function (DUF5131)
MAESSIEWTEHTWNPVTGCTKLSPGCKHCYAETMSRRLRVQNVIGHNKVRVIIFCQRIDHGHHAVCVCCSGSIFRSNATPDPHRGPVDAHQRDAFTRRSRRCSRRRISLTSSPGPMPKISSSRTRSHGRIARLPRNILVTCHFFSPRPFATCLCVRSKSLRMS